MIPPPDRINYAEMKVQRIQIPVQVAVIKPVYVDCPYPEYVFVQGESQTKLLERKYGNWNQFLNIPQLKNQIVELFSDSEDSESESEKEKIKKKKKSKSKKQLNNAKSSKEIQVTQQQQQQQFQQNQNQLQQNIQTQQINDNYLRPPILLDDRGSSFQKQNAFQSSLSRNQIQSYPTQNLLQTRNESILNNVSNVSRGRLDLQKQKEFLQKSQLNLLPAGEAGKSRYEYQNS